MTQGPQDQLIRCIVAFSQLHPETREAVLLILEALSREVDLSVLSSKD